MYQIKKCEKSSSQLDYILIFYHYLMLSIDINPLWLILQYLHQQPIMMKIYHHKIINFLRIAHKNNTFNLSCKLLLEFNVYRT